MDAPCPWPPLDSLAEDIALALAFSPGATRKLGPWDEAARNQVVAALRELAWLMVCCCQGEEQPPSQSLHRLAQATTAPWARAFVQSARSPAWSMGVFFPGHGWTPAQLAQCNARLRQWVDQALHP